MGKRYISKEALCPFYHSEDAQKIYCEGVVRQSSIHLAFVSATAMKEYMKENCCDRYMDCYIAQMLYRKYEEET